MEADSMPSRLLLRKDQCAKIHKICKFCELYVYINIFLPASQYKNHLNIYIYVDVHILGT